MATATSAPVTTPPREQSARGGSSASPARQGPERTSWWTLVAVSVAIFMLLVDVTIVNVALPDIEKDLNSSFADLQWVIDAYALTLAAFLLTAGSIGDRVGRRRLFAIGIALFAAASLGCGLSTSPGALTTFRAVQGVGGAIMFATSLALLASAYRGRQRGTAFGVYGAVTGASSAVGPLVGGVLVSGLSWRWIFYVNIPIGIVAIVITLVKLSESRSPVARRIDVPGLVTFSLGLALLVFALIRGNEQGWTSLSTVLELVGAAVLLIAFFVVESRWHDPMLDLSLLRVPTFIGAQVAAFAISAGLFALFLYLVLYLQNVLGYSALQTGVRLIAVSGAALVFAPIAGRLTTRVPYRWLISGGLVVLTVGVALMVRVDATSTWWALFPGLLLAGVGIGFVNAPLGALAVGVVDPSRSGMASGINSTARQVGVAVGTAVFGAIFTSHVDDGVRSALAGSGVPASARSGIEDAVASGAITRVAANLPEQARAGFVSAMRETFTSGLSDLFWVGAGIAAVAAVVCFVTIRQKDLHESGRSDATHAQAPAEREGQQQARQETPHREPAREPAAAEHAAPPVPALAVIGTVDRNAEPLAGAIVTLTDASGHQVGRTVTGDDGSYTLPLATGGVHVLIVAGEHVRPAAVSVVVADRTVTRDVTLTGGASVTGRVVTRWRTSAMGVLPSDDGAGGSVLTRPEDGDLWEGLGSAVVTLTDTRGEVVAATTTDDRGGYAFPDLIGGSYVLTAQTTGRRPIAVAVTVPDAGSVSCDLRVPAGGSLRGTVTASSDGHHVPEASVTLVDEGGTVVDSTLTGPDGGYSFSELPAGTYTVTAAGYAPVATAVDVREDETASLRVRLGGDR